jgi:hypothetical protein
MPVSEASAIAALKSTQQHRVLRVCFGIAVCATAVCVVLLPIYGALRLVHGIVTLLSAW